MERNDIILVHFPFTDYSSAKLRPALIISARNKEDICVAFISSVIPAVLEETDFVLGEEDKDFILTGLKKGSVFKMDKLATISKRMAIGKLGSLSSALETKINLKLK